MTPEARAKEEQIESLLIKGFLSKKTVEQKMSPEEFKLSEFKKWKENNEKIKLEIQIESEKKEMKNKLYKYAEEINVNIDRQILVDIPKKFDKSTDKKAPKVELTLSHFLEKDDPFLNMEIEEY